MSMRSSPNSQPCAESARASSVRLPLTGRKVFSLMLPVAFALLAIEMVFRMHRLAIGPRAPRHDAVSAS